MIGTAPQLALFVRILLFATAVVLSTHCYTDDSVSVAIQGDVVYGHKAGMALSYDVIKPSNANDAAVLFIVSGGWYSQWSLPTRAVTRFQYLVDAGFTVILIRHGSAPYFKVPEAVADVRRAVRHVRFHAPNHGIDPERMGVFGGSAGGHLSLMLGLASDSGDPENSDLVEQTSNHLAAVVAYFPPTDLRGMSGPNDRFPALDFDAKHEETVSPILFVSEDDPAVLLIHGDQDQLVPISHSLNLRSAMLEKSLSVELLTIEGAAHGFHNEDRMRVQNATRDFFLAQLVN